LPKKVHRLNRIQLRIAKSRKLIYLVAINTYNGGKCLSVPQRKARILFVYSSLPTFVRDDLKTLQKYFEVRAIRVNAFLVPRKRGYWRTFFTLFKGVLWADIVYSWWADLNAVFTVLFSALLRKKSIVVIGGYEVAYIPEIKYGTLISSLGRLEVKFILQNASKTIAVSESSKNGILRFATPKTLKVVYNGVDTTKFRPSGTKESSVITVVEKITPTTIKIKRLDTFLKASLHLPDVKFILVGEISGNIQDFLKKMGGPNVEFTGYLKPETLRAYYQKAKVYCQISTHESFGVALAEAMACGCVPVVTRKYSLPEIVGNTSYYVPYNDPDATADAIRQALTSDKGLKARARIQKYFSLKAREKKLINEISSSIEQN
jgi:glycosyltransferase involved in cell wall biosynthesis